VAHGHDVHFLERLERLSTPETELALSLYQDPHLIRALLEQIRLPESARPGGSVAWGRRARPIRGCRARRSRRHLVEPYSFRMIPGHARPRACGVAGECEGDFAVTGFGAAAGPHAASVTMMIATVRMDRSPGV
jgi:hypothetical protein